MKRPGLLVAIVGPSGSGKDTLLKGACAALQGDDRFVFARRVITRPPDGHEDNIALPWENFHATATGGGFLFWWEANGYAYALGRDLADDLAAGRVVVANLSRFAIPRLRDTMPACFVVGIRVSDCTVAARLTSRGRENALSQAARIARSKSPLAEIVPDRWIDNDGLPEHAVTELVRLLRDIGARKSA